MFNYDRASPCHLITNFMNDFKEFENPWSADNSEWFNEENDKWFDGGEYTEWLKEVPVDEEIIQEKEERTKGGYVYSHDGVSYGKLTNTGYSDEIYLVKEEDVSLSKSGKYLFKNVNLFKWKSGIKVLKKDFDFIVETLYAESSGEYEETLGIYNVCENRAIQDKVSVLKVITTKEPYGVAGSSNDGRKRYKNEKGSNADNKRVNCHKAFIDGVRNNNDITGGAYFWDGIDFSIVGKPANKTRYQTGYKFTNPNHNIWNQGDKLLIDENGNPTGKAKHGNYSYKYESVTTLGNTLFSKLSDEYGDLLFRKADGITIRKSNWNGSKPIN